MGVTVAGFRWPKLVIPLLLAVAIAAEIYVFGRNHTPDYSGTASTVCSPTESRRWTPVSRFTRSRAPSSTERSRRKSRLCAGGAFRDGSYRSQGARSSRSLRFSGTRPRSGTSTTPASQLSESGSARPTEWASSTQSGRSGTVKPWSRPSSTARVMAVGPNRSRRSSTVASRAR